MADESSKDNSTENNDGEGVAEKGRSRSKWLDSLIERLDDDEESGEALEEAAQPEDATSQTKSLSAAAADGGDRPAEGATAADQLSVLEALDASDEEEDDEEEELPEIGLLEPQPEDIPDIDALMPEGSQPDEDLLEEQPVKPEQEEAPEIEALEGVEEEAPEIEPLEGEEEEAPEIEPLEGDQVEDVNVLRSAELEALTEIPPTKGAPPPPPPIPGAPAPEAEEEGLSFEIGDEVEDDAPYGVSEQGEVLDQATRPGGSEGEEAAGQHAEVDVDVDVDVEVDVDVDAPAAGDEEGTEVDEDGPTIAFEPRDDRAAGADDEEPVPPLTDDEPQDEEAPSALELAVQLAGERDPLRVETALQREIESTENKEQQALLQHELGHLVQTALNNEGRAAKAYAQALNLDPSLRPNVWAIARIFAKRELWPNLLKLYDAQERLEQDDGRRAEILLEKGWLLQDRLGDPVAARESFWECYRVSEERWLAPLLALEQLDHTQGDVEDLAQVLRHMAETAEEPRRRAAVLMELARLQEQLEGGTPQVALMLLERAQSEEGVDPTPALELAERVARDAGLHRERCDILRKQAELLASADDSQAAAARLWQAARIARYDLDDLDLAQDFLEAAAGHTFEPLFQRERLAVAEERGDWERVLALLDQQLQATDAPLRRAATAFRKGIAAQNAATPEAGLALDEALEALPGFLPALAAKERQLLGAGDFENLVELYVAEADALEQRSEGLPRGDAVDAEWTATALWRAAALLHRQLGSPDRAVELCQRALEVKPAFKPCIDELEQLFRATGQNDDLADLLEREAETPAAAGEQAVSLLETLVALCDGALNQPERQLKALGRLHEKAPQDLTVLRRIAELQQRLSRYDDLDATLRELEQEEQDEQLKLQWRLRRAHMNEVHRGHPEVALDVYGEILQQLPTHPYAFPATENLLRRLGRHEELADHLRRAAEDTLDPDQKCQLLIRLASVYQRHLDRGTEAAAVFSELLELRPEDPVVLRTLIRTALDAEDSARLAEALERQADQEGEPTARMRHLLRLAEVQEDLLNEPARAEETYAKVVELAETTPAAVDALEALVRRQLARGDFAEARENLTRLVREGPEEARALFQEEQAWIAAGPLGDAVEGESMWDQVLAGNSRNARALWAKLRLAAQQRDPARLDKALSALGRVVEQGELGALLELRAGLMADAVGDPDQSAVEHLRQALRRAPENIEAVLALLAKPDLEAGERAELMRRVADLAPDKAREQMRIELAEVYEAAGMGRKAVAELVGALERDGDDLPAWLVLQRLAQAAGDQDLELRVWIKIGGLLFNKTARAEAFARAGELLEELGRRQEAAILYRQVLALRPDDDQTFQRLRRIYTDESNAKGLEELLGHQIRHADQSERGLLIGLHFERAELRLERGDSAGAARDMGQVLKHDPNHLEALRQLARLYDEDGNAVRALALYSRFVEASDSRSLKRPAVMRMAQLLGKQGRTADAIDACRKYLDLGSDDPQVLEMLADLYVKVRDFSRAIDALERLGELHAEADWKAENMRRVAQLHWKEMKSLQEARTTLMRARETDPCNIEVVGDLRQLSQQMGLQDDIDRLLERAKQDLRDALTARPLEVELYDRLMRVAEWHEDTYALLAALGVRCFLGTADAQDRELYERRAASLSFEPRRQTGKSWRDFLIPPGARNAFGEIWAVIAETVSRMHDDKGLVTDPGMLNVGRGDRVDRRAGGPVSQKLDPMAAVFGLGEYDIYMSKESADVIAGVVSEPPALVVGHKVVTTMSPAQRFRIGRTLSLLRDRAFALEYIRRDALERVFAAAIFQVEPSAALSYSPAELEPEARKLAKALPRKARKALPLAVNRYMQSGGDLDAWLDGVMTAANRSGLLAAGDIRPAMWELVEKLASPARRESMTPTEIIRAVGENDQAAKLLVYSVSSEYLDLRRDLQV